MSENEAREYIRFRLRVKYGTMTGAAKARGISVAAISKALKCTKRIPDWLLDEAGLSRNVTYTVTGAQS